MGTGLGVMWWEQGGELCGGDKGMSEWYPAGDTRMEWRALWHCEGCQCGGD